MPPRFVDSPHEIRYAAPQGRPGPCYALGPMNLKRIAPSALSLVLVAALAAPGQEDQEDRPLAAGDVAPTFTLNDGEGNLVTVGGESEEWTVLAFYPKALTGG